MSYLRVRDISCSREKCGRKRVALSELSCNRCTSQNYQLYSCRSVASPPTALRTATSQFPSITVLVLAFPRLSLVCQRHRDCHHSSRLAQHACSVRTARLAPRVMCGCVPPEHRRLGMDIPPKGDSCRADARPRASKLLLPQHKLIGQAAPIPIHTGQRSH